MQLTVTLRRFSFLLRSSPYLLYYMQPAANSGKPLLDARPYHQPTACFRLLFYMPSYIARLGNNICSDSLEFSDVLSILFS
jgi:hypothetical protein